MATEMVLVPKSVYERWNGDRTEGGSDGNLTPASGSESHKIVSKPNSGGDKATGDVSTDTDGSKKETLPTSGEGVKNDNKGDHEDISAIIETFPKNYRLYAKRLLVYIKKNGTDILEWGNDDKVVIYKGKTVNGSDIIELINYIFKTNAPKPKGLDTFRKGMDEIKVPMAYLKPYLLKPWCSKKCEKEMGQVLKCYN